MAGLRGKTAYLAAGKQTAKGTIATAAKHIWPFVDGSIAPTRETDSLQETDDKRDAGITYVKQTGVSGNPSVYVRDNSIDFLLASALGAVVDSGTMPNYTHTITPASALPYVTFWRMIGDTLFESFTDNMVSELVIRADAGGPLTAQATIVGLRAERLISDPAPSWVGVTSESGAVYSYNDATVTLSGGATSLVSSFELSISNNVTVQQTDDSVPYDLVPGTLTIGLSFDLIFETLAEYNAFHYGGTSGTTISPTTYTTSANFAFSKGVNNSAVFDFTSLAYEEFPVEPQPDGSPVTVSVRAEAQRNAGALMTATIKNQKATTF